MPVKKLGTITNKNNFTVVVIIIIYLILQYFYQDLLSVNDGRAWDAKVYCEMTETLNFASASIQFKTRILLPIILHYVRISADTVKNYLAINVLCAFLFMLYFYKTLRSIFIKYDFKVLLYVWLLVITSELSVARLVFFCPVSTDPLHLFLTIFTLYHILNLENAKKVTFKHCLLFFSLFLFGTLNREIYPSNLLLFGYGILAYDNQHNKFIYIKDSGIIKIILFSIAGLVCANVIISICAGESIVMQKGSVYLYNFQSRYLLQVAAALVNAYGILLLFYVNSSENTPPSVVKHISLVGLLATFLVALGGGGNVERFLYAGIFYLVFLIMPHVNALFMKGGYLKLALIAVSHIILQKIFFPIYHNGLGIHTAITQLSEGWFFTDIGKAHYSLLEVITGKGPAMIYWVHTSTNQMKTELLALYFFIIVVIYCMGIRCKVKFH